MVTVEATFCYKVLPNMTAPQRDLISPEYGCSGKTSFSSNAVFSTVGVKMSIRTWSVVVLLSLVALVPFAIMAQPSPAASGATLYGAVLDPDDALIPGATVALKSASGTAQSTVSKSDGTYTFRNLATGAYVLNVTAPGFAVYVNQAISVSAGANLGLDVKMTLQEQLQQVNVRTDTVALSTDPENNASSTVITGAALDALSDDRRARHGTAGGTATP